MTQFAKRDETAFRLTDVAGIVLAGSHYWGEGEFDRELRGPLIPVANSPLITYALEWLRAAGVPLATICAHRETESVRALLGNGASVGLPLDYFEDREARGPAGCAHDAARRSSARTFVVVEGAVLPSLDLRALIARHRTSGAAVTVSVELDRRAATTSIERRKRPGGVYVFERRALESVAARGYQDIKEGLLERLNANGEHVATHEVCGVSPRVLNLATYSSVNSWLISCAHENSLLVHRDYLRCGDGLHHATAQVHPSARFIGPVLLGPGVHVGADVVMVGPSSLGAGTQVRRGALISRSIIWNECVVGAHASVDSSLLTDRRTVNDGQRLVSTLHSSTRELGLEVPSRRPGRVAVRWRNGLLVGPRLSTS